MRQPTRAIPALSLALLLGALAPVALSAEPKTASGAPKTLDDLLTRVAPSVVAIDLEREEDFEGPSVANRRRFRGLPEEDRRDLEDYFKRPAGPVTGLLLDREGHVLTTNYNVGKKAKDISIVLADGKRVDADLVARDPTDDLALLKTKEPIPEGIEVTPVRWAPPESFETGRFVLAVGRGPDIVELTATLGIISSSMRSTRRLFQTDAALNYGNVGGPLIDLSGNVVGIAGFVGHRFPQWGLNSGIGFGIRADRIAEVLPQLKRGEDVPSPTIPFLGVGPERRPGRDRGEGARVGTVVPDSGASAGGIEPGDVIIEWDGTAVQDFTQLRFLIFQKNPGDSVDLVVRRDDKPVKLTVKLGEHQLPDSE